MRAVFFGTPHFAVPSLEALVEIAQVTAVVCQPDRPVGRGLTLTPPPVKARALALGLPVEQPTKLRTGEFAAWLRAQEVDVALVVAYGRILPPDVLAAPRRGCVNVHASLLPKYRGAAPITWAVVHGERRSGVTLMQMDAGMDTGPMLAQHALDVGPDETAGELSVRLAELGADAVRNGLQPYADGALVPRPQPEEGVSMAPMLKKEDGRIDWSKSARAIHDHVRGMTPWPGASTTTSGKTLKVLATRLTDAQPAVGTAPGTVVVADKSRVLVAAGSGAVELHIVQLEGKKATRATNWHLGRGVRAGDALV